LNRIPVEDYSKILTRGEVLRRCIQPGDEQLATILLAEDHEQMLETIAQFLAHRHKIVGRVRDGIALVRLAGTLAPDIAVVDISMPVLNGLDATAELNKGSCPRTKIVILTNNTEPLVVRAALTAGASAYVLKRRMIPDLFLAIEAALKGKSFISPPLAEISP
jgi:DNA-binding NarL/FixJ family response regulator